MINSIIKLHVHVYVFWNFEMRMAMGLDYHLLTSQILGKLSIIAQYVIAQLHSNKLFPKFIAQKANHKKNKISSNFIIVVEN